MYDVYKLALKALHIKLNTNDVFGKIIVFEILESNSSLVLIGIISKNAHRKIEEL